ncbi:NTP transferase domain-containing protein [Rhodobacteraceae bacterium D3-12]|nr:NTP transferase domain-containing protein [Rhodobacteraceae bacterium D3-12]
MSAPDPIAAIVLAAGKGTRMGSELHKVLHRLNGKPLLGHVLDSLDELGTEKTVLVVGAGRAQIADAYPPFERVVQEDQLGTGHAVRVATGALHGFKGIVLVLYGDVPLVSAATMRTLTRQIDADTALAVLGFVPKDPRAYGRLITDATGALERIVEFADASEAERAVGFCNSGILAMRADAMFDLVPQISNDNSKGEFYLTDVVALARASNLRVATVEADEVEVTGVNSQSELAALESVLAQRSREEA